jgi:uncharacterized protein (DUF1778 family)
MKKAQLRKQIRFKSDEQIKTIKLAVKIVEDTLTKGEKITFSAFVRSAAEGAAKEVIKNNPAFMKPYK